MPFVLIALSGPVTFGLIVVWAIRKRILTLPRVLVPIVLLALALLDFYAIVPLYLMPKTIWPPLKPEMTWAQLVSYICYQAPGDTLPRWWYLTLDLINNRPLGFWLTQIPFLLAIFPLVSWALRSGWPYAGAAPARHKTHGSTRWRRTQELKHTLQLTKTDMPDAAGIVTGSKGNTAWLTKPEVGNPHVIVIGATRSGKTRRVILPSIWSIGHTGQSMVVTDPKGELHAHTATWLQEKGYEVVLLDLLQPSRGNRWNPLTAVDTAYTAGNTEEATRLAWEIANILAFSHGPGSDPMWPQAEESLIAALCLATVAEAPPGTKHMGTAYRLLTQLGSRGGESLDTWIEGLAHDHPARLAYGTAALSESRTRSGIYTGTAAKLRLWGEQGIAWLCAESDHDPAQAGLKPMAIFILMPDEAGARRNIASLYVNQAYASLAGIARQHGGKLPVPVWFLLDEFGNVGKLPGLAEKLTVAAGRNIRFLLAVQAVAQIAAVYGRETAEIVLGNADTWLYLRTADLDTARVISAKAGQYTVRTFSKQHRAGVAATSASEGATARALLTPDEVLRWPMGQTLLLQAGEYPARLPLQDLSMWQATADYFSPKQPEEISNEFTSGPVHTWVPGEEVDMPVTAAKDKDIFGRRDS